MNYPKEKTCCCTFKRNYPPAIYKRCYTSECPPIWQGYELIDCYEVKIVRCVQKI